MCKCVCNENRQVLFGWILKTTKYKPSRCVYLQRGGYSSSGYRRAGPGGFGTENLTADMLLDGLQDFFQRYNDLNKSKESGTSQIEKLKEEVATLTKEKMAATSRESDSMREVRPR